MKIPEDLLTPFYVKKISSEKKIKIHIRKERFPGKKKISSFIRIH